MGNEDHGRGAPRSSQGSRLAVRQSNGTRPTARNLLLCFGAPRASRSCGSGEGWLERGLARAASLSSPSVLPIFGGVVDDAADDAECELDSFKPDGGCGRRAAAGDGRRAGAPARGRALPVTESQTQCGREYGCSAWGGAMYLILSYLMVPTRLAKHTMKHTPPGDSRDVEPRHIN